MVENSVKDFAVGDVVQHVFWCRYATVEKVGRKLLHVRVHLANTTTTWLPTSVRRVEEGTPCPTAGCEYYQGHQERSGLPCRVEP
jgi:hypothetical protein